jgi:hypothetical protein
VDRIEVGGRIYQDDGFGVGRCMVRFRCPKCKGEAILNAYRGQPFHHGHCDGTAMEPLTIVRDTSVDGDTRGTPNRGKA